jgi:hypothetical protein
VASVAVVAKAAVATVVVVTVAVVVKAAVATAAVTDRFAPQQKALRRLFSFLNVPKGSHYVVGLQNHLIY